MAIYLDEQVGPYLKQLLKRELKRLPSSFVAERLLKMVESDDLRKQNIATCEHEPQRLFGFKEECNKCHGVVDGFEEWVCEDLKETLGVKTGEQTTHQSQDFGNAAPTTPTHPNELTLL